MPERDWRGPRVTRDVIGAELGRIANNLVDDPVPAGTYGKYRVTLEINVQDGCMSYVKGAGWFERSVDYARGVN